MSTRTTFTYLFLSFALISAPAAAQTITVTDGAPSTMWDGSLTGFRLVAPNTQLNGEVMQGVSHMYTAGTRGELDNVINTSNASNHPFPEEINGVMYSSVWVKGQFTFTTQPFAVPTAADGARATFSTPFTATGTFTGYSDQAMTNQVFSVSIQGSGVASAVSMRYFADGSTWSFVGAGGEVYQFTQMLPSQWTATDVGAVGVHGISSFNANVYYVAGAGADIWGAADAFQFVSQPLAGDGSIVARVSGEQSTSTYAKAGIMMRQSTSASAADVILDVRPGGAIEFMARGTAGGSTTYIAGSLLPQPWLKLSRTGSVVTAAISADGNSWTTLGTATLGGSALAGLAVTSHDPTVLNQAVFDNVILRTSTGSGGGLPIDWTDTDIGTVGIGGAGRYSGGTFTVSGAGSDIWGAADSFNFASTPMNSDGFIEARVVSESNTSAFAKAGIMFRSSLDPGSTHVILDVKPDGFVEFMTRSSANGATTYVTGIQKSFPVALKLQRAYATVNSIVVAFVFDWSSSTWQQIGYVQVPLGPNTTAGLAVTSHNTSMLNTATIDSVAVEKNLLVEPGFEGYTPPNLGPGWVSDRPLRAVDAVTDTHPHNGYQNGACIQTTYQDCGLYQEVTAPAAGAYTLAFFANSDRGGAFVGVNVNGQSAASIDVPITNAPGNYGAEPLTLHFNAPTGATIRVWLYSPASPGAARIDDVSLTQDFPN